MINNNQIIWLKFTSPDFKGIEWRLVDISLYEFQTCDFKDKRIRQSLVYKWENETSKGFQDYDLSDYPPLTSKEHLILLCNIERPYNPKTDKDKIEKLPDDKMIKVKLI